MVDEWKIMTGENRSTRRKTSPSATSSTTYLTQTDLGSNPNLRGDRPATNCLNHGTVRTFRCFKAENAFCAIAVCYSYKCAEIRDCLHAEGLLSQKINVIYSSYTSVNNYTLSWRWRRTALTHSRLLLTWMIFCIWFSPYRAVNTLRLGYKKQSVNVA
jgi:hypothetical protein